MQCSESTERLSESCLKSVEIVVPICIAVPSKVLLETKYRVPWDKT
jgi:hypothetical protein